MNTTEQSRTEAERRTTQTERRQDGRVSERRLFERRGTLMAMADALEAILREEARAGLYCDQA